MLKVWNRKKADEAQPQKIVIVTPKAAPTWMDQVDACFKSGCRKAEAFEDARKKFPKLSYYEFGSYWASLRRLNKSGLA